MSQEPDDPAERIRMLSESASAIVPPDGSLDQIRAARFRHTGFARAGWATLVEMGDSPFDAAGTNLAARPTTIFGGSTEFMHNVLAPVSLNLPKQ